MAMSEATADWYVAHTKGQLRKVQLDGCWYLYALTPEAAGTASSQSPAVAPVGAEEPAGEPAEAPAAGPDEASDAAGGSRR
jgi:hypothetical protein